MEPAHILVAGAVAVLAAAAGLLALSGSSRAWLAELAARRIAPPAWILLVGVVLVAMALAVVVLRALGRGDDRTAILAVAALAVNQLALVLGVQGRRPQVAMAGFLVFAAAVLAVVVSAEWGRATVAAAVGCAVWVVVNLAWTGRLAYARATGGPREPLPPAAQGAPPPETFRPPKAPKARKGPGRHRRGSRGTVEFGSA